MYQKVCKCIIKQQFFSTWKNNKNKSHIPQAVNLTLTPIQSHQILYSGSEFLVLVRKNKVLSIDNGF